MVPRLVVAGTASGVGKTTVVVALAGALRREGLRVATFKCGPDYLDPTYHARVTGRPSHTLDGWMMGRAAVLDTFVRETEGCDLALIEGVMGLYDGASPDGEEGSAAQLAKWLRAPVIAVVDASGMARTIAALGLGLRDFDRELALAGLFANRVGGKGHLELLATACRGGVPIVGGLPSDEAHHFPERHLGLRTADEEVVPEAALEALTARFLEHNQPRAFLRLAEAAPAVEHTVSVRPSRAPRCRIAVARDRAFHFYYPENLALLESLGAQLVPFSPVEDVALPEADGLYLGGGYPEVHAQALAANRAMKAAIGALAVRGAPIYAECGGLMYLAEAIRVRGEEHPMLGLVPGVAVVHDRLQALGYVEVETQAPSILGPAGLRLRGHQFRYSTLEGGAGAQYRVRRRRGGTVESEGYGSGNLLASYVHAHWASNPLAAAGFVDACAKARR